MNEKRHQLLIIVQTMFLANAINIRPDDKDGGNRAEYSATAAYIFMDEAVDASHKIPENMTASEAAHDYAFYMIENLREAGATCPAWFARS